MRIVLEPYDPVWPRRYDRLAARIRAVLGQRVLQLEHVGSTSVPGLAAKPRVDIVLVVADSRDEAAYVPALEAAGFRFHLREPDWHEHRVLKEVAGEDELNLHVFSQGSAEVERMLLFRDWLRSNAADRQLYERTKRTLSEREWGRVQDYADAKGEVVEAIIARARAARTQAQAAEAGRRSAAPRHQSTNATRKRSTRLEP